jgi:hypothetical protein
MPFPPLQWTHATPSSSVTQFSQQWVTSTNHRTQHHGLNRRQVYPHTWELHYLMFIPPDPTHKTQRHLHICTCALTYAIYISPCFAPRQTALLRASISASPEILMSISHMFIQIEPMSRTCHLQPEHMN